MSTILRDLARWISRQRTWGLIGAQASDLDLLGHRENLDAACIPGIPASEVMAFPLPTPGRASVREILLQSGILAC